MEPLICPAAGPVMLCFIDRFGVRLSFRPTGAIAAAVPAAIRRPLPAGPLGACSFGGDAAVSGGGRRGGHCSCTSRPSGGFADLMGGPLGQRGRAARCSPSSHAVGGAGPPGSRNGGCERRGIPRRARGGVVTCAVTLGGRARARRRGADVARRRAGSSCARSPPRRRAAPAGHPRRAGGRRVVGARWSPTSPTTSRPRRAFAIVVEGEVAGLIQFSEELEPAYRHATIDLFVATEQPGPRQTGPMPCARSSATSSRTAATIA